MHVLGVENYDLARQHNQHICLVISIKNNHKATQAKGNSKQYDIVNFIVNSNQYLRHGSYWMDIVFDRTTCWWQNLGQACGRK